MKVAYPLLFRDAEQFYSELRQSEENVEIRFESLKRERELREIHSPKIVSVHGPREPLNERFKHLHYKAAELAKIYGAGHVVVHPQKTPDETERLEQQKEAFKIINTMREKGITAAIETFKGRNRILTPRETTRYNLGMALDTSHLDDLDVYEFMATYQNIPVIHLSGKTETEQHQPIDLLCETWVEDLLRAKWNGVLVVEYMPDLREQELKDARYLSCIADGTKAAEQNELELAVRDFTEAEKTKPNGYLSSYGLGSVLTRLQRHKEALPLLQNAETMVPSNADVLLFLALTERALGLPSEAHEQLCIELKPDYQEFFTRT
ncbi:hypothetical protein KY309_02930 [Candidatus Woesearchaeota archaeon]|nr:hypothetical protein [Candidatus Woesearchaeota archaeon]